MKVYFLTRRQTIVLLRWLMVIVLGYLLLFGPEDKSHFTAKAAVVLLLILSNIVLSLIPYENFLRWRLDYGILVADVLLVSGGIYLTGDLDLYLIYFLSIFMASLGQDVKGSLWIATIACVIYAVLFFKSKGIKDILAPALLIRLPLLYIIALFFSFLAQEAAQEKGRHQKTQLLLQLSEQMNTTADREKILEILQGYWSLFKELDFSVLYLFNPKEPSLLLKHFWYRQPQKESAPVGFLSLAELNIILGEDRGKRPKPHYLPAVSLAVLEDMTDLSRLSELKTEFVSHVSHELRTPLTSIKGAANILLRPQVGEVNAKQRKLLNIIREDCDNLVSLINDLLDLSKLESGIIQVRKREENIAEIAHHCIEAQRPPAEEKNVALSLQYSPDLPNIKVDRDLSHDQRIP